MVDLNVQLILRLVDRATGPARAAMRAIERLGGEGLMRQAERVNRGAHLMAGGLGTVSGAAMRGGAVLAGYAGTVAGLSALLVRPAARFEQLRVQLTNLEGSAAAADKALGWIEAFATRTPLQLEDTVAAYARLKAFGLDPTNGSLQALTDTMAATGGGTEQLDGLVLALGQAWTKQKLQGEEALQMLERGVPVWDLLGQKLGKTAAELQQMASKGQLGRQEITLLIDALAERNKGASEAMSRTWDGTISNILDHWGRFQRMIMGSGVFDYLKTRLREFLALLDRMAQDGRLQEYADRTARVIMSTLEALWAFGGQVLALWNRLVPMVAQVAQLLGGWDRLAWFAAAALMGRTVFSLIAGLLMLSRGLLLVGTGLIGMAGHATGLMAVLSRLGVLLGAGLARGFQLVRAGAMVAAGAIQWLGRALLIAGRAALANPILATIAAIAGAAWLIHANWATVGPWFRRLWDTVRQYFAGFAAFVLGVFTLDFGRAWDGIRGMWGAATGFFRGIWDGIAGIFSAAWSGAIAPVLDRLGLLDPILAAWQAFQAALGQVLDWIAARFAALMSAIRPVIDALRWVNDTGAALGERLGNAFKGDAGPQIDGYLANNPTMRDPRVPGRALGGPVRAGQIYRWQEEGQEFFIPRSDGHVISNRQLRAMQAMAEAPGRLRVVPAQPAPAAGAARAPRSPRLDLGGITINAAPGMDARAVARAVRREIEALARERGFALHDGVDHA